MNGGDCSGCRRKDYCHSQCRENKEFLHRIAVHAYQKKMRELMARNEAKEEVRHDS